MTRFELYSTKFWTGDACTEIYPGELDYYDYDYDYDYYYLIFIFLNL